MTAARVRRPVALLLLVLAALLTPASSGLATTTSTTVVRQLSPSHASPVRPASGRADHRPDSTTLTAATAQAPTPAHSTAAADRRPPAPQLLLVQRPRPPTHGPARPAVDAPTGRSPPSPAGT